MIMNGCKHSFEVSTVSSIRSSMYPSSSPPSYPGYFVLCINSMSAISVGTFVTLFYS